MKSKNYRIVGVFAVVLVAAILAIMLLPSKKTTETTGNKLQVVAAENFWGNILSQIGGDKVHVTSVISDPGADPHLYESSVNDGARLAKADIVVTNGLGYDDFMDHLLSASNSSSRQVLSVAKIMNAHGPVFEQALAKQDPANAKSYAANLATFNKSLQPVLDTLYNIKTTYLGTPVVYTERVPEYLLKAAGLAVKTPTGFSSSIEEGNEPSPAVTTAMENLITQL
jgi:zinc/manganese transport system substrate-binding protein